jgi:hypothetical protein
LWLNLDAPLDGIRHHPGDAETSPKWELMFSGGRYIRIGDAEFALFGKALGIGIEIDKPAIPGSIVDTNRCAIGSGDAQLAPAGI